MPGDTRGSHSNFLTRQMSHQKESKKKGKEVWTNKEDERQVWLGLPPSLEEVSAGIFPPSAASGPGASSVRLFV